MSYAAFLKLLLALGPSLPSIVADIQEIVARVQSIVGKLKPQTFGAESVEGWVLTDAEQGDEAEVMAALIESPNESFGAIGDGAILRMLYQFIKDNPALLQLILSLLAK